MRIPASHSLVFEYLRKWGRQSTPSEMTPPWTDLRQRSPNPADGYDDVSPNNRCGPGRGGKAQVHCCEGHSGRSSLFTSAYLRRESGG